MPCNSLSQLLTSTVRYRMQDKTSFHINDCPNPCSHSRKRELIDARIRNLTTIITKVSSTSVPKKFCVACLDPLQRSQTTRHFTSRALIGALVTCRHYQTLGQGRRAWHGRVGDVGTYGVRTVVGDLTVLVSLIISCQGAAAHDLGAGQVRSGSDCPIEITLGPLFPFEKHEICSSAPDIQTLCFFSLFCSALLSASLRCLRCPVRCVVDISPKTTTTTVWRIPTRERPARLLETSPSPALFDPAVSTRNGEPMHETLPRPLPIIAMSQ